MDRERIDDVDAIKRLRVLFKDGWMGKRDTCPSSYAMLLDYCGFFKMDVGLVPHSSVRSNK